MSNNKIKHLLDTAYKTDSIAKNKWRIENREQLREQRKKELKELMEKDKTMNNNKQQPKPENPNNQFSNTEPSTHAQRVAIANKMSNNKQQTSVEYLVEQLFPKALSAEQYYHIEQAKAMHKEEIIESYASGSNDRLKNKINTEYYNETFKND